MIYAIWDDNQLTLQLANSGLPRPLHCRNGKVEEIPATGLPVGLFNNATYEELTLQGQQGRRLHLFFSDGILDATSSKGQMFGRHRLEDDRRRRTAAAAPRSWSTPSSPRSPTMPRASRPSTIRPSSSSK